MYLNLILVVCVTNGDRYTRERNSELFYQIHVCSFLSDTHASEHPSLWLLLVPKFSSSSQLAPASLSERMVLFLQSWCVSVTTTQHAKVLRGWMPALRTLLL